jgi:hypothetical protein
MYDQFKMTVLTIKRTKQQTHAIALNTFEGHS